MRHRHDRAVRTSLSRCSAATASSAATSANPLFKSGRPGARRLARSAQLLFHPAARPGRPVRFVQADITNAATASAARSRARVRSINLVGVFGRKMEAVHVDGARNVAEAARDAGARALVHVSAIGADPQSQSELRPHQGRGRARRPQGLPRARRSSARRWCSGPRTISPTASRRWRGCPSFR